jgi:hypothetical protein
VTLLILGASALQDNWKQSKLRKLIQSNSAAESDADKMEQLTALKGRWWEHYGVQTGGSSANPDGI